MSADGVTHASVRAWWTCIRDPRADPRVGDRVNGWEVKAVEPLWVVKDREQLGGEAALRELLKSPAKALVRAPGGRRAA